MTALMETPVLTDEDEGQSVPVQHTIEVWPPHGPQDRVSWNTATGEGLTEARDLYERKIRKGFTACDMVETTGGAIGSIIHEFDESVDIRLMAPMAGG